MSTPATRIRTRTPDAGSVAAKFAHGDPPTKAIGERGGGAAPSTVTEEEGTAAAVVAETATRVSEAESEIESEAESEAESEIESEAESEVGVVPVVVVVVVVVPVPRPSSPGSSRFSPRAGFVVARPARRSNLEVDAPQGRLSSFVGANVLNAAVCSSATWTLYRISSSRARHPGGQRGVPPRETRSRIQPPA